MIEGVRHFTTRRSDWYGLEWQTDNLVSVYRAFCEGVTGIDIDDVRMDGDTLKIGERYGEPVCVKPGDWLVWNEDAGLYRMKPEDAEILLQDMGPADTYADVNRHERAVRKTYLRFQWTQTDAQADR